MSPVAFELNHWISKVPTPDLYALCVAILLAIWLTYWLGHRCCCWMLGHRHVISWRRLNSPSPWIFRKVDIDTYREGLAVATLFAANVLGLSLWTHSWAGAQRRAGSLAVIHLIPLCTGLTFGLPADILHIDRQTMAWMHRWVGRLCVLHSLFHGSLLFSIAKTSALRTTRHMVPFVAVCAMFLVVPLTHAVVVRSHRQFALKCHYLLAAIAVGALVYHLVERHSVYRWYLLGAICLWIGLTAVECTRTVLAHKPWRNGRHDMVVSSFNNLLWLDVTVPASWNIRPGQYVQLWMPRGGSRLCLQLPLFYVAFWEDEGTRRILRLVIRPRRGQGLAKKPFRDRLNTPIEKLVIILGPYGRSDNFCQCGTILFIVEDIGFFRILPYIGMLVQASLDRRAMVRKLVVLWQVKVEDWCFAQWADDLVQDILSLDRGGFNILQINFFCPDGKHPLSSKPSARMHFSHYSRITEKEVLRHSNDQRGDMVVAVCAGTPLRKVVRKTVQPRTGAGLRLVNFDLGPCHEWARNDNTLGGAESTVNNLTELNYELSSMGTPSKVAPSVPESGHPWPRNEPVKEHPESNHNKWVKSKLAEGQ